MWPDYTQIVRSYGISIFVTVVGTIISVIVMSLYAYPISRPDFPHRNFFSLFMFFTMLFNGGLVPFYLVYTLTLNLKNTLWALIMPYLVQAFFVLILRTFFTNTIPIARIESAKIDGASELKIFARIIMPLSLPVLATVALFQTLNYWNDWFLSLIFINRICLSFLSTLLCQRLDRGCRQRMTFKKKKPEQSGFVCKVSGVWWLKINQSKLSDRKRTFHMQ